MKKILVLVLLMASLSFGATYFVRHDGSDNFNGVSPANTAAGSFKTIKKASDFAAAGDEIRIHKDTAYVFGGLVSTNLTGVWSTGTGARRIFTLSSGTPWTVNELVGKSAFFVAGSSGGGEDAYAYKIAINGTNSLSFSIAEWTNREPLVGGTGTLVGIGDQLSPTYITTGGDSDTGLWKTFLSADITNQAVLNVSGSTSDGEAETKDAFRVQANMVAFKYLTFEDVASPASTIYCIQGNPDSAKKGLVVQDCQFNNVADAVHVNDINDVLILSNIISCNNATVHVANIHVSGNTAVVKDNIIYGTGTPIACSAGRIAIHLSSTSGAETGGFCVIGNIIRDLRFTSSGAECAAIQIDGSGAIVSNNTIVNFGLVTADESVREGSILIGGGPDVVRNAGRVGAIYKNIIINSQKGVVVLSKGWVGYFDYNCLYNNTTQYSGITAGTNDITSNPLLNSNYNPQYAGCKLSDGTWMGAVAPPKVRPRLSHGRR